MDGQYCPYTAQVEGSYNRVLHVPRDYSSLNEAVAVSRPGDRSTSPGQSLVDVPSDLRSHLLLAHSLRGAHEASGAEQQTFLHQLTQHEPTIAATEAELRRAKVAVWESQGAALQLDVERAEQVESMESELARVKQQLYTSQQLSPAAEAEPLLHPEVCGLDPELQQARDRVRAARLSRAAKRPERLAVNEAVEIALLPEASALSAASARVRENIRNLHPGSHSAARTSRSNSPEVLPFARRIVIGQTATPERLVAQNVSSPSPPIQAAENPGQAQTSLLPAVPLELSVMEAAEMRVLSTELWRARDELRAAHGLVAREKAERIVQGQDLDRQLQTLKAELVVARESRVEQVESSRGEVLLPSASVAGCPPVTCAALACHSASVQHAFRF